MQIAIVGALIIINGLLSMSEFAVVSSHQHALRARADAGSRGARAALTLSEQPGRFLSTVQIGITLVGILAGTFGGASIAGDLAVVLRRWGVESESSFRLALAIVVTLTSYLTLVVGELVPKQIAIRSPESVAERVAIPMRILSAVTLPFVVVLSASSRVLLWALGASGRRESRVTEDEVRVLVRQGADAGVFARAEAQMVESVFALDDIRVDAIMTPRVDVVWLPAEADRDQIMAAVRSGHWCFPVCGSTIDDIRGVVTLSALTEALLTGRALDLRSLVSPAEAIPESADAEELLHRITDTGSSFFLVLSEHGGMDGVATVHDLAEAVLGDMGPAEAVLLPDGSWSIAAGMAIEEVERTIGRSGMRGPRSQAFGTLSGFVLHRLGTIPRGGERFVWQGFEFLVTRVTGNRIRTVRVRSVQNE